MVYFLIENKQAFTVMLPVPFFVGTNVWHSACEPTELITRITDILLNIHTNNPAIEIDLIEENHLVDDNPFEIHAVGYESGMSTEFYINIYSSDEKDKVKLYDHRQGGDAYLYSKIISETFMKLKPDVYRKQTKWVKKDMIRPRRLDFSDISDISGISSNVNVQDLEMPEPGDTSHIDNILSMINGKFEDVSVNAFESLVGWVEKERPVSERLVNTLAERMTHPNDDISRCALIAAANLLQFSGKNVTGDMRKEIRNAVVQSIKNTKKKIREYERIMLFL